MANLSRGLILFTAITFTIISVSGCATQSSDPVKLIHHADRITPDGGQQPKPLTFDEIQLLRGPLISNYLNFPTLPPLEEFVPTRTGGALGLASPNPLNSFLELFSPISGGKPNRTSTTIRDIPDVLTTLHGEALPKPQAILQKVYFATDRNQISSKSGVFGTEQSDNVYYGSCLVSVPTAHRIGVVESPSIWKLEFKPNRDQHFMLLTTDVLNKPDFLRQIQSTTSLRPSILVFVHGYNVSFEDAAMRTAQIAVDMQFNGVAIFYSWPSQDKLLSYTVDENIAERTQRNLQTFLLDIADKSGAQDVYIIAHSMGNRPLTRALSEISKTGRKMNGTFQELILAAPDVDETVFIKDIAPFLSDSARRVTVYVSTKDKALIASQKAHHYKRAGQSTSLASIKGFEIVDASDVDTEYLGHSYFSDTPALLHDMYYVLRRVGPGERASLKLISNPPTPTYWKFALQ